MPLNAIIDEICVFPASRLNNMGQLANAEKSYIWGSYTHNSSRTDKAYRVYSKSIDIIKNFSKNATP